MPGQGAPVHLLAENGPDDEVKDSFSFYLWSFDRKNRGAILKSQFKQKGQSRRGVAEKDFEKWGVEEEKDETERSMKFRSINGGGWVSGRCFQLQNRRFLSVSIVQSFFDTNSISHFSRFKFVASIEHSPDDAQNSLSVPEI